jgi:hypothetical protein
MTRAEAKAAALPYLREFQHALQLERLVVCFQCEHFTFGPEHAGLGRCSRHKVEAFPFAPFSCAQFERRKGKGSEVNRSP